MIAGAGAGVHRAVEVAVEAARARGAPCLEQRRACARRAALGAGARAQQRRERRRQRGAAQVLRRRRVHRRGHRREVVLAALARDVCVEHPHAVHRAVGPVVVGRARSRAPGWLFQLTSSAGRRVGLERVLRRRAGSPATRTRPCPSSGSRGSTRGSRWGSSPAEYIAMSRSSA